MDGPRVIRDPEALEAVLQAPQAVLYKHSPLCGASASAAREVRAFMETNGDMPVFLVDVIRNRSLAREVARRLEVRHESPQAFVLRSGRVMWNGSHGEVTAEALSRGVAGLGPEAEGAA